MMPAFFYATLAVQLSTGAADEDLLQAAKCRHLTIRVMQFFALIRRAIERMMRSERGQGMVEYALILVLIAVVVIAVLIVLGNQIQNAFCNISGAMGQ
jgi:pilus assembly protein Flp/PilA